MQKKTSSMERKYFKKIIFILILIFSLNLTATFANLKVAYYDDYPLMFKDEVGKPAGFFIDLFNEIFKDDDIEIEYKYGSWSDAINNINSGEVDIILNILKSDRRERRYLYNSEPVFLDWGVVVTDDKNIENVFDLEGKTIGYVSEDYFAVEENGLLEILNNFNITMELKIYDNYVQILDEIEKGNIEVGLINSLAVPKIYNYKDITSTNMIISSGGIFIAGNSYEYENLFLKFDNEIRALKEDENSYFYERYDYWFNTVDNNIIQKFYRNNKSEIVLVVIVLLLALGYSRYEVYRKSRQLVKANKKLEDNFSTIEEYNESLVSSNKQLDSLMGKYTELIKFLSSNNIVSLYDDTDYFLKEILITAMKLISAVDYGFIFKYGDDDNLIVVDIVGHKPFQLEKFKRENLQLFDECIIINDDFYTTLEGKLKNKADIENLRLNVEYSKQTLLMKMTDSKQVVAGLVLNIKKGSEKTFKESSYNIMKTFKNIADSYFINKNLINKSLEFQKEVIFSIVELLEIHDEYTKGHSENVANISAELAKYIGLSDEKVNEIYWAGLVHDIGKITVSSSIINKIGKLTEDEYEEMKKHVVTGYRALSNSEATRDIATYILHHHERMDGRGYPSGLVGDEIPFESRIIALADTFDAMTSVRTYRTATSSEKAIEEIRLNLGTQFDEKLGNEFINMVQSKNFIYKKAVNS